MELPALASSGLTETVQPGGWADTQPESWVTVAAAAVTLQLPCSAFSGKRFTWKGQQNIAAFTIARGSVARFGGTLITTLLKKQQ